MTINSLSKMEFGDFQTPSELTDEICHFLHSIGVRPESVIEPTCGTGGFIVSAMDTFVFPLYKSSHVVKCRTETPALDFPLCVHYISGT